MNLRSIHRHSGSAHSVNDTTSTRNPIAMNHRRPPTPLEPSQQLRNHIARCADGDATLTPLFFSDDLIDIGRAQAICAKCPTRPECLTGALERREPFGVWGGELLRLGEIATKRPAGRPPKQPHPALLIDEMGVIGIDPADARRHTGTERAAG